MNADEQSLTRLVDQVVGDLGPVERTEASGATELRVGERLFAVLGDGWLDVALDAAVAAAARRTPDVDRSDRGPGWVRFRPTMLDQFSADRAEAWLRSAHRRVATD
jgi:hypothetical protein